MDLNTKYGAPKLAFSTISWNEMYKGFTKMSRFLLFFHFVRQEKRVPFGWNEGVRNWFKHIWKKNVAKY